MKLLLRFKRFLASDRFKAYLEGYAMTFDLFPCRKPFKFETMSPQEALRRDWQAVMRDMEAAMRKAKQ